MNDVVIHYKKDREMLSHDEGMFVILDGKKYNVSAWRYNLMAYAGLVRP